jgi:hypothetical protein
MDLTKREINLKGKRYAVLAGKPIPSRPNRTLYLLSAKGEGTDYSLWLAEPDDNDGERVNMWPYEGPDTEKNELIKELLEDFFEHAFDE